jgi:uncharacterized membrane protein
MTAGVDDQSWSQSRIPRVVLAYGLAGVLPFVACPLVGVLLPDARGMASAALAAYGALILSFLGGARWAFAVSQTQPDPKAVGLAMLPTLTGVALVTSTWISPSLRFLGLALALGAVWRWDVRGSDLPGWYGRLRSVLTLGAGAGLCAGALVLHG